MFLEISQLNALQATFGTWPYIFHHLQKAEIKFLHTFLSPVFPSVFPESLLRSISGIPSLQVKNLVNVTIIARLGGRRVIDA